jgi:hypothetical protein
MILVVKAPMNEEWDEFLKKWSLAAMNSRGMEEALF